MFYFKVYINSNEISWDIVFIVTVLSDFYSTLPKNRNTIVYKD